MIHCGDKFVLEGLHLLAFCNVPDNSDEHDLPAGIDLAQ